jgi:uncharacterized protein with HEPN domain
MQPEAQKLLFDVIQAIEEVERFLQGCSREKFLEDRLLQVAAERELEIIGEALNRLYRCGNATFSKIEQGSKIIGMRNILAHGYDVIDYRILWNTLQEDVPELQKQVEGILKS